MSLAALTHAATAPAFNGLFYATAATVIPVLPMAAGIVVALKDEWPTGSSVAAFFA
jgi:hypothetical protein